MPKDPKVEELLQVQPVVEEAEEGGPDPNQPVEAEPVEEPLEEPLPEEELTIENSILLEDDSRAKLEGGGQRGWRVSDGQNYYEHCSNGPGGEWVYRPIK